MALRHVADAARDFAAREGAERDAVEDHASAVRLEQAEDRAEKRRLAAAVRPGRAHRFACGEREADVAADGAPGEAKCERLDLEHYQVLVFSGHHQLLLARAKSQRKNGVPMSAVSTPGGTSIVATVRQSVSTPRRNAAPSSMASGSSRPKSGPTRSLAACGMSSPT